MLSANESKLQFAQTNGIAIHTISTENYEEEIVQLNVSNSVKEDIKSAVSNGRIVIIPEETLHINQWSGSGYMVLDPDTYACGYMISGGLSGEAMTIEQVHAGTIVQSFNPGTLAVSEKKVETTFVKQTSELIHISLKNEMIDSTTNHPFYVLDRGFVKAKDLRAGDILCTVDGDYVVVEQVQHEILESPVNANTISKFGGAYRIESIPPEIEIIQRGTRMEHYEIVPKYEMSIEEFQMYLDQIEISGPY